MPINVALTLAFISAVICTILSFVFIVPKSRRNRLNGFLKFVHDLFNFKFLIVEMILKAFYVFSTLFVIGLGFFLLFSGYQDNYGIFGDSGFKSFAGAGILVMLIGPVVVRIVYEFFMITVLLVKNVIEINNRAKGESDSPEFGTGGYTIKRPDFVNNMAQRYNGGATESPTYRRPVHNEAPQPRYQAPEAPQPHYQAPEAPQPRYQVP